MDFYKWNTNDMANKVFNEAFAKSPICPIRKEEAPETFDKGEKAKTSNIASNKNEVNCEALASDVQAANLPDLQI